MNDRASAAYMARESAKRLDRKAYALRVIADLVETHLETGSNDENAVWEFICDQRIT